MKMQNFPQNIFLWLEFCCSRAALEEIQHELENQSQTSQTCSQSSDTMFHCFSAHDSFLDDCIRLRPSNSIFQRVIFRINVYLQPPAAQNRGVWMCFWGVCNGSQQNPFTGSVCGAAYVQNVQNVSEGKKKNPDRSYTFLFSLKEWAGLVLWGREERRVTRGERESFSWTHFMDVLGSGDENPGRLNCPFLPLGSLRCQSKQRKRGRASRLQHRMSSVSSALTSVKTSLPQSFATALPLQVRSMTPRHRTAHTENVPMWHRKADKGKRGHEKWKAVKPHLD